MLGASHQCVAALRKLLAISPALLRTLSTLQAVSFNAEIDFDPQLQKDRRYVDRLKITARAGKGGNGCLSFYQGASRGVAQGP